MSCLQTLREARTIVRWMLVWFALSIGVAVAAPVVHPQAMTLICTTAGSVKWVAAGSTNSAGIAPAGTQTHGLDCVLCLPSGALPVQPLPACAHLSPAAVMPSAHAVALPTGLLGPASARGPPSLH
ncbi:DUF2946 family protein [Rhodoferax sp. OV413]|uniref:DUF2946 family protein n=1 Tax=Rhodoferax sp. OV413 TaxID=1855285 RepID=UPI0025D42C82|nr:DUF2946 family protein [Rhodoferax sp. OV413]